MWIVAIAWIYVVGLMAFTESSIVAGVMTFVGYCVIPLSILFYLTGGKRRRARRERNSNNNSTDHSDIGASGPLFAGSALASDSGDDNQCSNSDSDSSDSSGCSDSGGSDSSSD